MSSSCLQNTRKNKLSGAFLSLGIIALLVAFLPARKGYSAAQPSGPAVEVQGTMSNSFFPGISVSSTSQSIRASLITRFNASPDGRALVFEGKSDNDDKNKIYFVHLSSSSIERISDNSLECTMPQFSPSSTINEAEIAFVCCDDENACGVYLWDSESHETKKIVGENNEASDIEHIKTDDNYDTGNMLTWRPGNFEPSIQFIASSHNSTNSSYTQIYEVKIESGEIRALTPEIGEAQYLNWSSNGENLYFALETSDLDDENSSGYRIYELVPNLSLTRYVVNGYTTYNMTRFTFIEDVLYTVVTTTSYSMSTDDTPLACDHPLIEVTFDDVNTLLSSSQDIDDITANCYFSVLDAQDGEHLILGHYTVSGGKLENKFSEPNPYGGTVTRYLDGEPYNYYLYNRTTGEKEQITSLEDNFYIYQDELRGETLFYLIHNTNDDNDDEIRYVSVDMNGE